MDIILHKKNKQNIILIIKLYYINTYLVAELVLGIMVAASAGAFVWFLA